MKTEVTDRHMCPQLEAEEMSRKYEQNLISTLLSGNTERWLSFKVIELICDEARKPMENRQAYSVKVKCTCDVSICGWTR